MRKRLGALHIGPWRTFGAGLIVGGIAFVSTPSVAGAAIGWSRSPDSGLAGASVRVTSSASTPCLAETSTSTTSAPAATSTTMTAAPATGTGPAGVLPTAAGTRVDLRLERTGVAIALGSVPVTDGGAWAGVVTVPPAESVPAGAYRLVPRCVVGNAGGAGSYDLDALAFDVLAAPPPTTVEPPVELVPPITAVNPVEVQGEQISRGPAQSPAPTPADPTLPDTGAGTATTVLAGLGAILLGGGSLWWGSRAARRAHPPT